MSDPEVLVRTWFEAARRAGQDRLPAERVLAERLGLSRAALRKGLATLEAEGALLRQVGRGTFLRDAAAAVAPPQSDRFAPLSDAIDTASPRDFLTARLALEPQLARLAAREATSRKLEALRDAESLLVKADSWPSFDVADDAFHLAIAQAGGNPLMVHLFNALLATRRELHWGRLRERGEFDPAIPRAASADHAKVRAAIADRNADAAQAALADHVRGENLTIDAESA